MILVILTGALRKGERGGGEKGEEEKKMERGERKGKRDKRQGTEEERNKGKEIGHKNELNTRNTTQTICSHKQTIHTHTLRHISQF